MKKVLRFQGSPELLQAANVEGWSHQHLLKIKVAIPQITPGSLVSQHGAQPPLREHSR
jgi:hypothetical protein